MEWHSIKELSPSCEAANCAATLELASILWSPKVHHRVHKSPPLVPILSQINPIHTILHFLSKIHFNIVHPPTSWSSQWSLSFWLSHQYPIWGGNNIELDRCIAPGGTSYKLTLDLGYLIAFLLLS
jgi:hypothetical protein